MRFFKNKRVNASVGDLSQSGYDDAFKESVAYFSASRDVVYQNIFSREIPILNKFAKGELRCSTEELDIKLNKEVINETAVRKYAVDDSSFALTEADWFPRLRTKRVVSKNNDNLSNASSEEELYDGFSGPWSWETSSLQEMGFPPTPELEPKNNANNNKKNKRKKNLTVTGEEGEVEDIRTLETLDELKARLKANYIEAKEQREKYLNLDKEQTPEEKLAKSVRGTRDKSRLENAVKTTKAITHKTSDVPKSILGSFRTKRDESRPYMTKRETPKEFTSKGSFHSELSSAVLKKGSTMTLDVPDSPDLIEKNTSNTLSPPSTDSPTKPLLLSSSSSGSDILGNTQAVAMDESFEHISLNADHHTEDKGNTLACTYPRSNTSIAVSSEGSSSPELIRKDSKRKGKKILSRESSIKSRESIKESQGTKDSESKDEFKGSFEGISSLSIVDSNTFNDDDEANQSVIKNDNNYEVTMGLGNVMDMLSNW